MVIQPRSFLPLTHLVSTIILLECYFLSQRSVQGFVICKSNPHPCPLYRTKILQWFNKVMLCLTSIPPVSRTSRIASLDSRLFEGVLRVGGRIDKAELPWETKHPIILDHGHDITRLIIVDYHRNLIHAGVEHVF